VIEAEGLVKRYGATTAVDGLTFTVQPGKVTGFLGPNGSGKSTAMRLILGLDMPDAGVTRIDGHPYRDLRWPLREVGSMLEARARAAAGRGPIDPTRPREAMLARIAEDRDVVVPNGEPNRLALKRIPRL
jgi:energy-coupling factor transporter ATP-binding protein EcfA2